MRHFTTLRRLLIVCAAVLPLCLTAQASAQATPCADLLITDTVVTDDFSGTSFLVQGEPAHVAITIRNAGTCAAGGFVTQFRTSVFSSTGPSDSVNSLAAGATTTLNLPFNFPQSGDFETVVEVDTGHAVSETNEVNNLEIKSITVQPPGVNLTISKGDFLIAPGPTGAVVQGRVATATITVRNTGNVAAGSFRVEWTPFFLATPLSRQVNGLARGASTTLTIDFTFPFAGTVTGTATADSTNTVAESIESDNTQTLETVVEPPLPDLSFDEQREGGGALDINAAPAGSVSTLDVHVVNDGNDPAGDFIVRWQPWFLATPLTEQVNGLPVGASTTVHFDYTFPFAGTFDGTVTLDPLNSVAEVDESDNTKPTTFVIPAATVDLTITSLTIVPSSPIQGAPATATLRVQNLGNSPSGRFVVDWNPDAFGIIVPSVQTLSKETGPLGPGDVRDISFDFTYPQAGNFRSIAHVDSFNTVQETNEANNERILNVTVQPAPIDLVFVGGISFPAQVVRGVETTATVTVRNDGPIATGPFGVQFKSQAADFFPQTQFVNGLNPGETRTLSFKTTYATTGTFTASATVDVFGQVVEPSGEGNNTIAQSVNVVPQSSTLDVTLKTLTVVDDGDESIPQGDDGEWDPILFAVLKSGANCNQSLFGQDLKLPGVECTRFANRDVNDEASKGKKTITANKTIRVTLEEFTPLLLAVAAADEDEIPFQGAPFATKFPDPRGLAFLLAFPPDYLTLGTKTLTGQGPCVDNGGHCLDAVVEVKVVNTNVPRSAARTALKAAQRATSTSSTARSLRRQAAPARRALRRFRAIGVRLQRVAVKRCSAAHGPKAAASCGKLTTRSKAH